MNAAERVIILQRMADVLDDVDTDLYGMVEVDEPDRMAVTWPQWEWLTLHSR